MGRNNESRSDFKWFCKVMEFERQGSSNMFKYKDKIWCYSIGNSSRTVRQMYDESDGVYVSGRFIERKDLRVGAITRISPSGAIARNAKYAKFEPCSK